MSDGKYTPGPWQTHESTTGPRAAATVWLDYDPEGDTGFKHSYITVSVNHRLVAIVPCGEGDPDADARLIAAAPELLAVCERLMRVMLLIPGSVEVPIAAALEIVGAREEAANAIAKAKGA